LRSSALSRVRTRFERLRSMMWPTRDTTRPPCLSALDIGVPIARHLSADEFDLCLGKPRWLADLQAAAILPRRRGALIDAKRVHQAGIDDGPPFPAFIAARHASWLHLRGRPGL